MSFPPLTRHPLPYDPESGVEARAGFPDLPADLSDLIAGAAGCSPYLRMLMAREQSWTTQALTRDPQASLEAELAALNDVPLADLSARLRQAKRRVALLAALADLGGVWSLDQVTGALTDLADRATHVALTALVAEEIRRRKLPGMTLEDAASGAGMVVLAMGKMGARELN